MEEDLKQAETILQASHEHPKRVREAIARLNAKMGQLRDTLIEARNKLLDAALFPQGDAIPDDLPERFGALGLEETFLALP